MTKCIIKQDKEDWIILNPRGKEVDRFIGYNAERIAKARADMINKLFYGGVNDKKT